MGLEEPALQRIQALAGAGRDSDPRLQFALGSAFAALGRDAEAAEWLGKIPPYTPMYVPAHLICLSRCSRTA